MINEDFTPVFYCDIYRYKPPQAGTPSDDPTPDYMNLLGMIFSMCGLMMKVREYKKKIIFENLKFFLVILKIIECILK